MNQNNIAACKFGKSSLMRKVKTEESEKYIVNLAMEKVMVQKRGSAVGCNGEAYCAEWKTRAKGKSHEHPALSLCPPA